MDFWIIIVGAVALTTLVYVVFLCRPSRTRWNGTGGSRWVSSSSDSYVSSSSGFTYDGGYTGGDSGGSCGGDGGGGGGGCD